MDLLQSYPLQVVVIKSVVCNQLLQERDELNGVVLIWFGQVEVLEV